MISSGTVVARTLRLAARRRVAAIAPHVGRVRLRVGGPTIQLVGTLGGSLGGAAGAAPM